MLIKENGKIVASASLCGDVVKYFAVNFEHRGGGVSAALFTEIKKLNRIFLTLEFGSNSFVIST